MWIKMSRSSCYPTLADIITVEKTIYTNDDYMSCGRVIDGRSKLVPKMAEGSHLLCPPAEQFS